MEGDGMKGDKEVKDMRKNERRGKNIYREESYGKGRNENA
jgi:hypothetical protein